MPRFSPAQRQHLIELLEAGEELPLDYKNLMFPLERQEAELAYADKEREEDILADTMAVPLQPIRSFGESATSWRNMLVLGDNLQAMKTLLLVKNRGELVNSNNEQGIKVVYIDPPFASKQEFRAGQDERAYQDKIIGSQFIEFLRKRLIIIRELLSNDGSLFIHLDQRKAHYLKIILDEVFGEHNFRNEIILPGRASKNLQQQFKAVSRLNIRHDTLLWYSKSGDTRFAPLWVEKHNAGNPEGHWHHFWSTADRRTMRYPLFGITPETGQWTWKEERAQKAVANYERFLKESGGRSLAEYWRDTGRSLEFIRKNPTDGTPQYWRAPAENRMADTVWSGVPIYANQTRYPTEKNEALLAQVLQLASEEGDIVMDGFAGSGTTLTAAEKLGRRWIGIDCGKVAVYTIQKRMLNLKSSIGNTGPQLQPQPFTLSNAGLYDFSQLRSLPWHDWRFFALNLFECEDNPHVIGGVELDGYRGADDVLVFSHIQSDGVVLDYGFIDDLHAQLGSRVGSRFFIIAPAASVAFLEDYIDRDDTRYYILRIPYSIINELHSRDFEAITQPMNARELNATVEMFGFDFIQPPLVECDYLRASSADESEETATVRINTFKSQSLAKGASGKGNLETLSMILVDYDYRLDDQSGLRNSVEPFELDEVFYAADIADNGWKIKFPYGSLGHAVMLVFIDIYGNEYVEVKRPRDFKYEVLANNPVPISRT